MATSLSVSRLLSSSAISVAKPLLSPTSTFAAPISFSRSLSPNLSLKLQTRRTSIRSSSSTTATTVTASISVGDKLPDSTLSYLDPSTGDVKTVTVSSLTAGKKTILFAVPGAFTPTCSQKHVPGFVSKAGELRSKGVDVIACVSVNDAFVMEAWRKDLGVNSDEVMMLSDGNGEFTGKLGVELDLRDKPVGLGVRSRRYAILAEDGVVKVLNLEEGGAFTNSSAEDMLKAL